MTRPPKKSESLEIRIPQDTKQALMARSRAEGKPASEVIRGFIDAYLAETACSPTLTAWERNMAKLRTYSVPSIAALAAFAVAGGVGLGLVATPATARPDLEAAFKDLDVDGDGVLSAEEFGTGVMIRRIKTGDPAGQENVVAAPVEARPPEMMLVMRTKAPVAGKPVVFAVGVPRQAEAAGSGAPAEIRATRFASMDGDKDGRLSFEEFETHHKATIDRAFAAADADKDGFLSAPEIAAANRGSGDAPAILAAFDRDTDGKLSR
ncbi:hypothetical protein AB4144_06140, partial [Rhizobiaceae sp. 2RAB30]